MDESFEDISRSHLALSAAEREQLKAEKRRWLYAVRVPQLRAMGFAMVRVADTSVSRPIGPGRIRLAR